MATSGTATDPFSGRTNYYLEVQVSRRAVSGNSSQWNWSLWAKRNGGALSWLGDPFPWSVNIEGTTASGSHSLDFRSTNSILIASGFTPYKAHNADGYLTIDFSGTMTASFFGTAAVSGSFAANRIAKAPDAPPAPVYKGRTANSLTFQISGPADNGGSAIIDYTMNAVKVGGGPAVQWVSPASSQTSPATLEPATSYNVQYSARNAIGSSSWSPPVVMTTAAGKPSKPLSPTATNLAPTSFTLAWLAPAANGGAAITGYTVRRALDPAFTLDAVSFDAGTALSYAFTGLAPSTKYYFQVTATNAAGTSDPSDTVEVTTVSGVYYSNGTTWIAAGVFVSDGTDWDPAELAVSNGTAWIAAN